MTEGDAPIPDESKRRKGRSPGLNSFFNWLAVAVSVLSLVVSGITAYATFAQVQAIHESTTEKLVLMGITAGILDAEFDDMMGEPSDRSVSSIKDEDVLSVWMDVSNNGRAAGSITEMSYLVIGERPVPIYQAKCASRNSGAAEDCVLPLPLDQGQQVRLRIDFDREARASLICPTPIGYILVTLTDSAHRELNVGTKYDEPPGDCSR